MTTTTIPLTQLVPSAENARRTGCRDGIDALAASIEAHGLRQNLNVRLAPSGRYEVVAGGRRLAALKRLAKQKKLAKDAPIPCLVLNAHEDATEISLAENSLRLPMHPDDQCNAFRALVEDKAMPVEDAAARFGVTPAVVRQRLKLANVSPALRARYREGELSLEHMMALAITDDHTAQEAAWDNLPDWNRSPYLLKQALTHEAVALSHKLARLVGVEAYTAAGGTIIRDLFDADDEGYMADAALVQRLAAAHVQSRVEQVQAEGWKRVWAEFERDYTTHYSRVCPRGDGDSLTYAPEDLARAGARVLIEPDGSLRVERGLIHPNDREQAPSPEAAAGALAASLVTELTAHRTAALRLALARNPSVALAATVHALATTLLDRHRASSLALCGTSERLDAHAKARADCTAHDAMDTEAVRWADILPDNREALFAWCLAQPQDVLLDLLAFLAALSVNAVQMKGDSPASERAQHADALAHALGFDIRAHWMPSAEGFFARLSKAQLGHVLTEIGRDASTLSGRKRDEAARYVAKAVHGTDWLPQPLRCPSPEPEAVAA